MISINVSKIFKNISLHFRFSAETNRIVVFGPSGSGKSVLLKMIAGFFDPEEGDIIVGERHLFSGKNRGSIPIFRRNIGYLPQEYTLFPNMSVEENILYGTKIRKIQVDSERYLKLVDRLGIRSKLKSDPNDLSGGQKQRAALARILLVNPGILLLDEPFSALDSSIRESLRDLVMDLADELNITTLFVTHDLEEAFIFGKEIVLVNTGRVVEHGMRERVFDRPVYVETAELMGFHNIWPVTRLAGNRVKTEFGTIFTHQGDFPPEADYLCIRPENIMLLREDRPYKDSLKENVLSATVLGCHHRGKYMNILVRAIDGMMLNINLPEHAFKRLKLDRGKELKVSLKEESVILCKRNSAKEKIE